MIVACVTDSFTGVTEEPPHHGRNVGYSSTASTNANIRLAECPIKTDFSISAIREAGVMEKLP